MAALLWAAVGSGWFWFRSSGCHRLPAQLSCQLMLEVGLPGHSRICQPLPQASRDHPECPETCQVHMLCSPCPRCLPGPYQCPALESRVTPASGQVGPECLPPPCPSGLLTCRITVFGLRSWSGFSPSLATSPSMESLPLAGHAVGVALGPLASPSASALPVLSENSLVPPPRLL